MSARSTARTHHTHSTGSGQGRDTPRAKHRGFAAGVRVLLREDFHQSSGSPLKVNRDAKVIHRVKILGWESKNGRRYLPEAAQSARQLYEGCKVYADHPAKAEETRSVDRALGVFRNVEWTAEGLYADLHYFESHPLSARVCEDAERGLGVFGMSHNADGETEIQGGETVVVKITEVRSVDLVTDPATVSNLWESQQGRTPMAQTTLKKILEAVKLPDALVPQRKALLEMGDELAAMPMDEPLPPEEPAASDWRTTLGTVAGDLLASEDVEAHEIAKKIVAMLKPAAAEVVAEEEEEGGGEEEKDEEEEKPMESRKAKAKAPGVTTLTEEKAKRLCKLAGVEPEAALLETMKASTEDTALKLLEWAKGKAAKPAPTGARSQPAGSRHTPVNRLEKLTESKDIAAFLTGRN